MLTKELLKQVRQIEIRTKGLVNHLFSGEYHSVFKGRGMEFSEVREYQYGDDIRNIDGMLQPGLVILTLKFLKKNVNLL